MNGQFRRTIGSFARAISFFAVVNLNHYVPPKMRLILFINMLLILNCTSKQESKEPSLSNSESELISTNPEFRSEFVKKFECSSIATDFDLAIKFSRFIPVSHSYDSCILSILILEKDSRKLKDSLKIYSDFYGENRFLNCNGITKYTEERNLNVIRRTYVEDDILVSDFNFDGREDLAIVSTDGSNWATCYKFYLQNENGKMYLDHYLTDSLVRFPDFIDFERESMVTYYRYGSQVWMTTFSIDKANGLWTKVKSDFLYEN